MADQSRQHVIQTVKDYSKRLFSFIRGKVRSDEDAEDILQEVWYQLSKVVNIAEIEQMGSWLFQVARNKIIDKHRKKKPYSLEEFTYGDGDIPEDFTFRDLLMADPTDPENEYFKELFWRALFEALDELPEKQRQVFVLNELEDMTLQQIAQQTGENLKTIISRKGYAVKHLRQRLAVLYKDLLTY